MTTNAETSQAGFRVFFSYAHEDRGFLEEVRKHLAAMERSGLVAAWDDRMITAGADWEGTILESLERADVILLLISADFLASDYCWDVEMRRALVRQAAHEALVVPIILRPCDWAGAPFSKLECLPTEGRPIVTWSPQDAGFLDVAEGLREALAMAQRDRQRTDAHAAAGRTAHGPATECREERVLDAAVGSVVPVGRATDVVTMVRTPESGGLREVLQEPDSGYSARSEDVRFADFTMDFPVDPSGRAVKTEVVLRLESDDFDPASQEKTIEVGPGRDSRTCVFLVTARREGPVLLNLELRQRGVSVVQRLLRTSASEEVDRRAPPSYVVQSAGYAASSAMQAPPSPAPPVPTMRPSEPTPPPTRSPAPPPAPRSPAEPRPVPDSYLHDLRSAEPPRATPPGPETRSPAQPLPVPPPPDWAVPEDTTLVFAPPPRATPGPAMPSAGARARPSRTSVIALVAAVVVIAGAVLWLLLAAG